jgi:hypothetical protein
MPHFRFNLKKVINNYYIQQNLKYYAKLNKKICMSKSAKKLQRKREWNSALHAGRKLAASFIIIQQLVLM